MKICLGNKCYTEYSKGSVPHENCHKQCDICYLWYQGWRVRRFKFLFITLLQWSHPGMAEKYIEDRVKYLNRNHDHD